MRSFFFIFLVLCLPNISFSEIKLKPLSEVIVAKESVWNTIYIMERCVAVTGTVATRFKKSTGRNKDAMAPMIKVMEDAMTNFLFMAVSIGEKSGLQDTVTFDSVGKNSLEIMKLYADETDKNWYATGNAIDGIVKDDLEICMSAFKEK